MTNSALAIGKPPYRVERARLPNGLQLVTVETPHLHSATLCLYVRAGSRYETAETNGLSHFLEHMLFRGSARYPTSFALNLAIEELGGTLYAETGRDYSLYQIALNPRHLQRGLEILGDLFAAPEFRDIDLERQIIVEEILEDLDDRGRNVNLDDQSRRQVWGEHPLGFPITGPLRNVRRFTTRDVRAHFRRFYGAANMVLAVAGPIRMRTVERQSRAAFAARAARRAARAAARRARPGRGRASAPCTTSRRRRRCTSCFTRCPRPIPTTWRCARSCACSTTGCRRGCTTRSATRRGSPTRSPGRCTRTTTPRCSRSTPPARTPSCRRWSARRSAMLGRFRDELVGEDELDKAKRRFVGDIEACYDDLDGLCGWFGGTELYTRADPQEKRARALARVRPEDIRAVARRVIRPERLSVTVGRRAQPEARAPGREDRPRVSLDSGPSKGPAPAMGSRRRSRRSLDAIWFVLGLLRLGRGGRA